MTSNSSLRLRVFAREYQMMTTITIKNYQPPDIAKLAAFFERYRAAFPAVNILAPEFHTYHPAFAQGQNVFCVRKRNTPAVAVYTAMGFQTINEEVLLGLEI